MGNALLNFKELAQLEEREPKVVEMIERFEATQRDFIKESVLSSMAFMRLFGDIAQLYFPTMLDIAMGSVSDNPGTSSVLSTESDIRTLQSDEQTNRTPDWGRKQPPEPNVPGADGPTQV